MRVAAYVRVSTQEEQQVGSFEMQIVYFKSKIESNPDWELVKIYQDYGVSGTSTNKRQGFKDMLNKYFKEEHHTAIIKKSDWQKVQQILDEKPLSGKSTRLHAMPKRFTVTRSKDKYFRGYIILDPRWTASERRELLKELKNL